MSFLTALGKIGAGIAAPFTGGLSAAAIPILDQIGKVTSGAAAGSAAQRVNEAPAITGAYNANLNATALGDKRAALASLLGGGLQDVQIGLPAGSTIPQFNITGGLRPSAMNQQALLERLSQPIAPLELPKAGTMEKVLGGVGLGTGILGALGNIAKKPAQRESTTQPASTNAGIYNPSGITVPIGGSGFVDPTVYGGTRNPWAMY